MLHVRLFLVAASVFALILPAAVVSAQVAPKPLAPGVLTVIDPVMEEAETFTGPMSLIKVLEIPAPEYDPHFTPKSQTLKQVASSVTLRRKTHTLEFAFKPLRLIEVDIPDPTGVMQKRFVWYLVYRVRNLGGHLQPVSSLDARQHTVWGIKKVDETAKFRPHFVLRGMVMTSPVDSNQPPVYEPREYLDRIIPVAQKAIQKREDPSIPLLNSVEMGKLDLKVSDATNDNAVWGVATWEYVDPRVDFLSIFVKGLSNAFRLTINPDGTRSYSHKTLQLNFYRPGDAFEENEKEIVYGVPIFESEFEQTRVLGHYGLDKRVDFRWIYR